MTGGECRSLMPGGECRSLITGDRPQLNSSLQVVGLNRAIASTMELELGATAEELASLTNFGASGVRLAYYAAQVWVVSHV